MYFLDYGQSFGGAANTLLQQAILMKKAGLKITIVISDYLNKNLEDGYLHVCNINEISWIQLTYPICSHTEDIDIISVIENYDSVKAKIEELKPDILHSVQINPIVELISRELKIPHIMNIYQLSPDFFSVRYIDIFPHYHVCDSYYFAKKWNRYLGTESICIRTTVSKDDKPRFLKNFKNKYFNYMCVGSLYERKNQFEVIKAFHKALQYGIKGNLLIYGYYEGTYGDKCKNYIIEHRLDKHIILKGFCADMLKEYQKNDVLICGSTIESYPNVISEALANGLIIISTPVAGVPEIIKDHYNGYLCKGFTSNDILEKIIEFFNECHLSVVNEMSNNAIETFEKYHSEEVITNELLKYYNGLIGKNNEKGKISIDDLKKEFDCILSIYNKNMDNFIDKNSVSKKLWYIYHIMDIISTKILKEKKQLYIWGTGKYGIIVRDIINTFWRNIKITGYIDSYKKGFFDGYEIVSPVEVINNDRVIIIIAAINGQEEMIRELNKEKKVFNSEYFILSPRVW